MERLIKKSTAEFTYKFISPITVNIGDEFTWKAESFPLTHDKDYEPDIEEALNASMDELGPTGLAQYIRPESELYGVINSIVVTMGNCVAVTVVKASKELSDDLIESLKDYITGQFSDGWGEGFEQNTLAEWTESGQEENFDEEEQETYMEDVDYKATMSASFYDSKNWSLELQ